MRRPLHSEQPRRSATEWRDVDWWRGQRPKKKKKNFRQVFHFFVVARNTFVDNGLLFVAIFLLTRRPSFYNDKKANKLFILTERVYKMMYSGIYSARFDLKSSSEGSFRMSFRGQLGVKVILNIC